MVDSPVSLRQAASWFGIVTTQRNDSEDPPPTAPVYEGEAKDGMREGIGKLKDVNGDYYEGQWCQDMRDGYGTQSYATGEKYQGQWVKNFKEGIGTMTWIGADGDVFEGYWSDGFRAKGKYLYDRRLRTYSGLWRDDTPFDVGVLDLQDGVYHGELSVRPISLPSAYKRFSILRQGKGQMTYTAPNNTKYYGCWKGDKREGYGVFITPGFQYYGNWSNDKKSGIGLLLYDDGTFYEGEFYSDKKHGKGQLCFPNGDVIKGSFQYDSVDSAKYSKGSFPETARPMRTLSLIHMNSPIKIEERDLFLSKLKWKTFCDDIVIRHDANDREVQKMISTTNPSSITVIIDGFVDIFLWNYSEAANPNQSPAVVQETKIKLCLAKAVDDITSFIEGILDSIEIKRPIGLTYHLRKKLRRRLLRIITTKLHTLLFNMYKKAYRREDSLLLAKIAQLKGMTLEDYGIEKKYLIYKGTSPPEKPDPTETKEIDPETLPKAEETDAALAEEEVTPPEEHAQPVKTGDEIEETEIAAPVTENAPAQDIYYGPNDEPFYPVIQNIRQISVLKTPTGKLRALLKASKAILLCVDSYYSTKKHSMFMGAEEKFPVLIYATVKAAVPLWAHCHFLEDFLNANVSDPESSYRIEELSSVLKYISSLDCKIRDEAGVVVPLDILIQRLRWSINQVKPDVPIKQLKPTQEIMLKIFLKISEREKVEEHYEPIKLKQDLNETEIGLLNTHSKIFFTPILKTLGLNLVEPDLEVVFIAKYPLFVYLRLFEALTEEMT